MNKPAESAKNGAKNEGDRIWAGALGQLRTMLNPDIFKLWFQPIRVGELSEGSITLLVANDFCGVWLKDNYQGLIKDVLATLCGLTAHLRSANLAYCTRVSKEQRPNRHPMG